MSLQNVQSALLENKQKRDAEKAATQPVVTTQTPAPVVTPQVSSQLIENKSVTPVEKTIEQPVPPAPKKDESVTQTPEVKKDAPVESKTTDKPKEEPQEQTQPVEEFKWDSQIPDKPVEAQTVQSVDFKKIGSALSLEVTNEEQLVKTVTEKLTKLKSLEENLEGVPDTLKQTLEIAKQGGDWLSYAGVTALDVSKLDAVEEFEKNYERANAHRFKHPVTGEIDYEKLDAEIDSISEGIKAMEGERIKASLAYQQNQRKAQIVAQAVVQRETFQKTLGEATSELAKLLPKETFGIQIEPKHSAYLYEGIANGSLIKKHIGAIDLSVLSKADAKKLVKTVAIAEFGESMSQFQYKQGKAAGEKSLLHSTQNIQLNTPSSHPTPEGPKEEVKESSADITKRSMESKRPKNSL